MATGQEGEAEVTEAELRAIRESIKSTAFGFPSSQANAAAHEAVPKLLDELASARAWAKAWKALGAKYRNLFQATKKYHNWAMEVAIADKAFMWDRSQKLEAIAIAARARTELWSRATYANLQDALKALDDFDAKTGAK